MPPVPKRKTSKSRRNKRRGQDRLKVPKSIKCKKCGALKRNHRVCPKCGEH